MQKKKQNDKRESSSSDIEFTPFGQASSNKAHAAMDCRQTNEDSQCISQKIDVSTCLGESPQHPTHNS